MKESHMKESHMTGCNMKAFRTKEVMGDSRKGKWKGNR